MDSYSEQLLKKKPAAKEIAILVLLFAGALVITTATMLFLPHFGYALMITILAWWGALWLSKTQHIEYEYLVINGDVEIDEIRGKRKRKRIVQVRGRKIEDFLPVTDKLALDSYDRVVIPCTTKAAATFYITYHSKKNGRTIVLMEPDKALFAELYGGQPRIKQLACEHACRDAGVLWPLREEAEDEDDWEDDDE